MTRRRKIIIAAIAAALLLLALVLFISTRKPSAAPAPAAAPVPAAEEAVETPEAIPEVPASPLRPTAVAAPTDARTGAIQLAELFAERYGSYSNQESYQNLRDLLPVMSQSLRKATEAELAKAGTVPPAQNYEGVTSAKISTKVLSFSEAAGTASLAVTLQETKTVGTAPPEVSYRTLRLSLVKEGEDWKVDAVKWEK